MNYPLLSKEKFKEKEGGKSGPRHQPRGYGYFFIFMSSNRRKPFSGKQKKQQLQERNQRKRTKLETLEEQTQDQTAEQLALLGEPKRNNGPNLEVHTNK